MIHPFTWVDERLFGWTHSARRRGSSTGTASGAASRQETPNVSDDEDEGEGDYDNVIGYLSGYEASYGKKPSRTTSYADLQLSRQGSTANLQAKGKHIPVDSQQPREDGLSMKSRSRSRSELNLAQLAPVYHKLHAQSKGMSPLSSTYSLVSQSADASTPPSPTGDSWPHIRRQRKASLSDGVNVERIGALSPVETFKTGTDDLNKEIQDTRSEKKQE